MPREHRARAVGVERATDGAELMVMDEVAAKEEAAKEEVAEEEETINVSAVHYRSIQQDLVDIHFRLVDQRREARQDKLEADERFEAQQRMLRDILAWLPLVLGASSLVLQ
jgi:hypothetical protein